MQRRLVLLILLVALVGVVASACSAATPAPPPAATTAPQAATSAPAGKRTLVVAGWGGLWQQAFTDAVAKPFESTHPGVEIVHMVQAGGSGDTVAKLRAEKAKPTIDIVGAGGGFERMIADEGLVEEFVASKMPNLKDVYPTGIYKNAMVANSFAGVGLAYHKEKVPREPNSWMDLWDPAFKTVGISDMSVTYGRALFSLVNKMQGGTNENTEPGWKKYEELITTKKPIINVSTDDTTNAIVARGAVLSIAPNSRAIQLISEGYPLGYVYPKEGALAWGTFMGVVANSPNKDLAMEFINYWLEPEVQSKFCIQVNYGPANKNAKIPAEYKYTKLLMFADTMASANILDWDALNKYNSAWTERWTTKLMPLLQK